MLTRLCLIVSLAVICAGASVSFAKPDRIVLGYSATWFDDVSPAADYNFDGLTHIARSFLQQKSDGSIDVPPGYFNPGLEKLAHAHGVKLLMSVGGAADTADDWVALASHAGSLDRFVDTIGRLMADNHYDGVDIDWEPAPLTDAEGVAYGTLLKALRAKFPKAIITTALPAGEYWVSHMNWADVMASVDFVNVMTYDYAGAWGGIAAHGSNLFPPGAYPPQPEFSVAQGMESLLKTRHLPPKKLVMGLIFNGYRFRAARLGDRFPAHTPGYADNPRYGRVMDLLGTGQYLSLWDEKAKMPYLQRDGGGAVIAYENPESIRAKCEYAKKLGVAGVMIWHIASDASGRQSPLMDAVAQSFGAAATTLGPDALVRQAADVQESMKGPRPSYMPLKLPATRPATEADAGRLHADLARLRAEWGVTEDRRWQAAGKTPPAKPAEK